MVGRCREVNQGSRAGNSDGVHGRQRPEEPCPEGDRASIGATKRGNARGAKGGRDMEAAESKSRTAKAGVVPERAVRARDEILLRKGRWLLASGRKKENERRAVGQRSHPEVRWRFARTESVHCLESRMREICPSGSGGGVANRIATPTSFVTAYPLSRPSCQATGSAGEEVADDTNQDAVKIEIAADGSERWLYREECAECRKHGAGNSLGDAIYMRRASGNTVNGSIYTLHGACNTGWMGDLHAARGR